MDDSTLPPTGDMSVDPARDQPQKDGGERYLGWNLGDDLATLDDNQRNVLTRLGAAVVTQWAELPRDIQKALFESAAGPASENFREAIAKFLHEQGEHHV